MEESANQGIEIVAAEAFTADSNKDFSTQLQKSKDAGAELVFLPIYYTCLLYTSDVYKRQISLRLNCTIWSFTLAARFLQLSSAAIFKGATGRESLNTKLLDMIALLL